MNRLPILSSEDVVAALKRVGFDYAPKRGKGSHIALYKTEIAGRTLLVIVPKKKEIPRGTLLSILKQADLTKEEFLALLG